MLRSDTLNLFKWNKNGLSQVSNSNVNHIIYYSGNNQFRKDCKHENNNVYRVNEFWFWT